MCALLTLKHEGYLCTPGRLAYNLNLITSANDKALRLSQNLQVFMLCKEITLQKKILVKVSRTLRQVQIPNTAFVIPADLQK